MAERDGEGGMLKSICPQGAFLLRHLCLDETTLSVCHATDFGAACSGSVHNCLVSD